MFSIWYWKTTLKKEKKKGGGGGGGMENVSRMLNQKSKGQDTQWHCDGGWWHPIWLLHSYTAGPVLYEPPFYWKRNRMRWRSSLDEYIMAQCLAVCLKSDVTAIAGSRGMWGLDKGVLCTRSYRPIPLPFSQVKREFEVQMPWVLEVVHILKVQYIT